MKNNEQNQLPEKDSTLQMTQASDKGMSEKLIEERGKILFKTVEGYFDEIDLSQIQNTLKDATSGYLTLLLKESDTTDEETAQNIVSEIYNINRLMTLLSELQENLEDRIFRY